MVRRIIFSLKGWGIASFLLAIALFFQHFFRNPLCFSWACMIWLLVGIGGAILTYSFIILPFLPNKKWLKTIILSLLFLIIYFINLFIYQADYVNNLLFSGKSILIIVALLIGISYLTTNIIRHKNNLIIRQIKMRTKV